MSEATFVHDGDAVDYTPTADTAPGEVVVQESLVGVANTPIAADRLGALAVRGVFDVVKDPATEFTAGQTVYWDAATRKATDTGTVIFGTAVQAATTGALSVRVLLCATSTSSGSSPAESGIEGVGPVIP